jgi:hypothetical protein
MPCSSRACTAICTSAAPGAADVTLLPKMIEHVEPGGLS